METKFNFKSAICTSRSQSERLLALGLKKETADMMYESKLFGEIARIMPCKKEMDYFKLWDSIIPAWSLHRLLMMLDSDVQTDGRYISLPHYGFVKKDNIYDNLCDCIEWLIKEGYFNKEYLV